MSTIVIKQLIALQEHKEKDKKSQIVPHSITHDTYEGYEDEAFDYSKNEQTKKILGDGQKSSESRKAKQDLRSLLKQLRRQGTASISSYITYEKLGDGEFVECSPSELECRATGEIKRKMFYEVRLNIAATISLSLSLSVSLSLSLSLSICLYHTISLSHTHTLTYSSLYFSLSVSHFLLIPMILL